ncbi:MAG: class I SAM-dependent methyltransferase, partial [Hyphomicrobium sp.]
MFPLSQMLKSFIRTGTLTVEDAEGKIHKFGAAAEGAPNVTMKLTDPKLYRALFFNPELHAGEAYMDGRMSFPGSNLRDFLTLFSINRRALKAHPMQKVFQRASRGMKRFQQYNPVGKAQANVAHHYDIGNDLYEMFLDEGMFYSCAYFRDENDTLEQAQINKCRLIAAKLQLKPGMKVLDIGCGWGGLAMYLARIAGVEVLGVTLSKEQLALAQKRCHA